MNEPIGVTPKVADSGLTVVPYREELRAAFEQLNREWGFPLASDGRYRRANIRLERELRPTAPA